MLPENGKKVVHGKKIYKQVFTLINLVCFRGKFLPEVYNSLLLFLLIFSNPYFYAATSNLPTLVLLGNMIEDHELYQHIPLGNEMYNEKVLGTYHRLLYTKRKVFIQRGSQTKIPALNYDHCTDNIVARGRGSASHACS